jgi:hypothetical protein
VIERVKKLEIWMTSKTKPSSPKQHAQSRVHVRQRSEGLSHAHSHSLSLSATTSPTEMMKRFQEDVRPLGNSDGMETDADARMVFSVRMAFFLGLAEH